MGTEIKHCIFKSKITLPLHTKKSQPQKQKPEDNGIITAK